MSPVAERILRIGDSPESPCVEDPQRIVVAGLDPAALPRAEELECLARETAANVVELVGPPDGAIVRAILCACRDLRLAYRSIDASGRPRDLVPEDLFRRVDPGRVDPDDAPFAGRDVLVTGAAGSIGGELCTALLRRRVASLTLFDADANALDALVFRLGRLGSSSRLHVELGDIRDANRLARCFARGRPQDVFHAAALKQVPLLESQVCEAISTNVGGTRALLDAAATCGVERLTFISTDKAVRPASVMGATKRVGERLVLSRRRATSVAPRVVRFGNVLGTSGSVVPRFLEQIAAGGPLTVTDPDARRWFLTVADAVERVLAASVLDGPPLWVLEMGEPVAIRDLAEHLIALSGAAPAYDMALEYIGLRPGEKRVEQLWTEEDGRPLPVCRGLRGIEPPEALDPRVIEAEVDELLSRARTGEDPAARAALCRSVPELPPDAWARTVDGQPV